MFYMNLTCFKPVDSYHLITYLCFTAWNQYEILHVAKGDKLSIVGPCYRRKFQGSAASACSVQGSDP